MLKGKTIVIAGTGPGLGARIAATSLQDGANVFMGARSIDSLQNIAKRLTVKEGLGYAPLDVTDTLSCEKFVSAAAEQFNRIDGLVIVSADQSGLIGVMGSTEEMWRRSLEVNVMGPMNMIKAAVPHLKAAGGGAIVLIGTQGTRVIDSALGDPKIQVPYCTSKAAMTGGVLHLAAELGPDNIRVNIVSPTWMWGQAVENYFKQIAQAEKVDVEEVIDRVARTLPLKKIPRERDIADAVIFFCSDRAKMISGQELLVNAGQVSL